MGTGVQGAVAQDEGRPWERLLWAAMLQSPSRRNHLSPVPFDVGEQCRLHLLDDGVDVLGLTDVGGGKTPGELVEVVKGSPALGGAHPQCRSKPSRIRGAGQVLGDDLDGRLANRQALDEQLDNPPVLGAVERRILQGTEQVAQCAILVFQLVDDATVSTSHGWEPPKTAFGTRGGVCPDVLMCSPGRC